MAMRPVELDAAMAAVEDACRVCRHVQRRLDALRSMTKDDASPVTIGDFASQALVARGLVKAGAMLGGMVAEESAAFLKHPDHRAHLKACVEALRESGAWADATADEVIAMVDLGAADPEVLVSKTGGWTLDPIDGTKGFLRGEQYCVCLAKIAGGKVELGVLGCPNLAPGQDGDHVPEHESGFGSRYWAARGQGAHMRYRKKANTVELRVQHRGAPEAARLAESVEMTHTRRDLTEEIVRRAGPVGKPVQIDSQCKYALLARGDADVYLRLPSRKGYVQRIWDHAPGVIIAQEAGCLVTDVSGAELDFSQGRGLERNVGILGAPPGLHGRLVDAAKSVLDSVA
jgi:3'(2'), 5'-bisphosphate nucleotidase